MRKPVIDISGLAEMREMLRQIFGLRELLRRIGEWDQMNPPMTGDHAYWKLEIDAMLGPPFPVSEDRGDMLGE